jgi:hypothetical protein
MSITERSGKEDPADFSCKAILKILSIFVILHAPDIFKCIICNKLECNNFPDIKVQMPPLIYITTGHNKCIQVQQFEQYLETELEFEKRTHRLSSHPLSSLVSSISSLNLSCRILQKQIGTGQ